jgi:hypothetical protein
MNLRDSGVKDVVDRAEARLGHDQEGRGRRLHGDEPGRGRQVGRHRDDADPGRAAGDIYNDDLACQHEAGRGDLFAHGLNVHFNLIEPRVRPRRVHDRAEGPRPHRALRVPARRRRALPDRGPPELLGQRARDRAELRLGGRRRSRRHHRDHLQGRVRDRPVRRAGRPVRRPRRADQGRLRDAGRGRLRAGDGVFRVPARGEADRRPHLRGRHRQHELLDLQHRRVRRIPSPARASSPPRPRPR